MARIRSTKLLNLRDKSWYSITNKVDGPTQVHIYDEIGYVGVTAQQFMADIAEINGDIEVHLNTPGGEVFDGIAIYNCLKQRGNVTVIVDSLAASIGSVIACAGNPTVMAKNSQMMIHDGFGMTVGNAADMREMADLLDKTSDNIASIYADKTHQPASQWRNLMKNETWLSAQEAVDAGLADQIQGSDIRNSWDLTKVYDAAPHGAFDGTHSHPHPAYGDQGGDSSHGHEHTHNGDDNHSHHAVADKTTKILNDEKYSQDDRDRMSKSGEAMDDGSYPVADAEDLDNAVHAVGRGNADHDAIRQHIIKRAHALGHPEAIPENWNADGSLNDQSNWTEFAHTLRASLQRGE
jgi:ATP-dependent Clp endopeptidase proteolytic subunit ClpP